MFAIEALCFVLIGLAIHNLVPPNIATFDPITLLTSALYNENMFNVLLALKRTVHRRL